MNQVLYSKVIVPARDASDGETPTRIQCTQEVSGFGVFITGADKNEILKWFWEYEKEKAIEFAVDYARECLLKPLNER